LGNGFISGEQFHSEDASGFGLFAGEHRLWWGCMTVLNIRTARAIWLVDSRDLNPRGIDIFPILDALRVRYNFQTYPTRVEEANEHDPKGIVFANGSFATGSGRLAKATMYGDGIVVDSTSSTEFGDAFLADALTFLSTQFGLTYQPDMVHTKIYVSEMIVRINKDLAGIFAPLTAFQERLRSLSGKDFQPAGFAMSIDPASARFQPVAFKFEREAGKPFSQFRYFTSAPLRTNEHEDLLRHMEPAL